MSTKLISALFLLLFTQALAHGIGVYNPGDELFIHAGSGLVLRKTADAKGAKLQTLSYGDAVKVLKTDFKKKPHAVEEFKGFSIKGFWVKVSTADGKEGYVFDGYLSKYRPMVKVIDDTDSGYSLAEFYLLGNTEKKGEKVDLPKSETRYERYKQLYKNGAEVEIDNGEGGSAQKITFQKGITVEEAYLIGKALWMKDIKANGRFAKGMLTLTSEDELNQIEVSSRAGITVLNMQHAD